MMWLILVFLILAGGIILMYAGETSGIGKDSELEVWMAPVSGRIFLYNPKTKYMENDEYGVAEVSGNQDQWVLEKIGDFTS